MVDFQNRQQRIPPLMGLAKAGLSGGMRIAREKNQQVSSLLQGITNRVPDIPITPPIAPLGPFVGAGNEPQITARDAARFVVPQSAADLVLSITPISGFRKTREAIRKLPRVRVVDADEVGGRFVQGALEGSGGRSPTVLLNRDTLPNLTRAQRSALVRHEMAHSAQTDELLDAWDTEMWKTWERNNNHPVFLWMEQNPRIATGRMDNRVSTEAFAEMYATSFEKGKLLYHDPRLGREVDFDIPEKLMDVLRKAEEELGIFGKRAARRAARSE